MKKLQAIFIVLIMVLILGVCSSAVLAADQMTLNIDNVRPFNDDNGDGEINDTYLLLVNGLLNKVFKIGETTNNPNQLNFSKTIYCLRFGLGFGDGTRGISSTNTIYSKLGDMIENDNAIINYYKTIDGSPNLDEEYTYTESGTNYTFTPYNSILWLVDNMALPTSESSVNKLIQKAGIANSVLTADDIDVVQQAAFWFFSNYDEEFLRGISLGNVLKLSTNGSIEDYDDFSGNRGNQIETLYNYLINNARKNGSTRPADIEEPTIGLDNTLNATIVERQFTLPGASNSIEYYVVGPFKLNITNGENWDINIDANFQYTNSASASAEYNSINGLKIKINEQGQVTNYNYDISEGEEFYVAINKNDVNGKIIKFKLGIDYTYQRMDRTGTIWTATAQDQPVLYISESPISDGSSDEAVVDNRLPDFALRKFITKVERDGSEVEISNLADRVPQVDASMLNQNGETTAIYKHRKAPVEVKRGDKVTYTLRIYNEGDLLGRVTQVVDHLPVGLDLDSTATAALANGRYNVSQSGRDITINITDTTTIAPFTDGTVSSYDYIQIVCIVSNNLSDLPANRDNVLTNIAEIKAYEVSGSNAADRDNRSFVTIPGDLSSYWGQSGQTATNPGATDRNSYYVGQEDDDDFEKVIVKGVNFDLSLRKYISSVIRNGEEVLTESREPVVDIEPLLNGETTAKYKHKKAPVEVKTGDKITYTLTVYNEGQIAGKATKIVDHLPDGLELDETATSALANGKYEVTRLGNTVEIRIIDNYSLPAFTGTSLSSYSIQIVCKISDSLTNLDQDKVLTNIAEITEYVASLDITDRDNESLATIPENLSNYWGYSGQTATRPGSTNSNSYYKGQEDDDDFEKVFIKGINADFALRKYITKINGTKLIGLDSRVPDIDISGILPKRGTMNEVTTATYKHKKSPVEVKDGDIVTYTITVYNEGEVAGKVIEIIDHLPVGLVFDEDLNPEFIAAKDSYTDEERAIYKYSYQMPDNQTLIIRYLEDYTLAPITNTSTELDKKEVDVVLRVNTSSLSNLAEDNVLTNIAEITEYQTVGNIPDRDNEQLAIIPANLSGYWGMSGQSEQTPGATNPESYYEGQEDDDDFEKVIIKGINFDLSLRKFISSVKRDGKEVLDESREPIVDTRLLQRGGKTASYTHPKIDKPVVVKNGDIITYTIRVYNEGDVDGYANIITDHIPEGLEFMTNSPVNTKYLWAFENPRDLSIINTTYWSKTRTDAGNIDGLIKAYNPDLTANDIETGEYWQQSANGTDGLFYRDVQIEFKVVAPNTFAGNIVNIAEIKNSVAVNDNNEELNIADRDSTNPVDLSNYDLKPAPANSTYQEDDDDYEVIQLRYFDLALRKFITAVNDDEITGRIPEAKYNEETGNIEYVHPKTPVEVSNADLVTYTIRVYNEGTIAGYAEEIADDIPEGLIYVPTHTTNLQYRWKMIDENGEETHNIHEAVRLTTDYLSEANGEAMMQEGETVNPNLINAFNPDSPISNVEPYNPDFRDVKIVFQIDESPVPDDRIIINHAQITEDSDDDDDSTPDEWIDTDDDQDIEKVYVRIFDLSLQKWVTHTIVSVDGEITVTETGFGPNVGLTDQDGRPNSENEPVAQVVIDKNKLNSTIVKFVYAIRVANEGDIAGYATEITDYIPQGLRFVEEDNPLWTKVGEDKIITHALEETLLEPGESAVLEVVFTWINGQDNLGVKTNIAAITEDYNDAGDTPDIDSTPGNTDIENYDKEQEDDDDYALVILTLKTGGNNSYIAIALVALTIVATGAFFIKRFVL